MTLETHAAMVQKLKSDDYQSVMDRMTASPEMVDIQHAATGIHTEGAEIADAVKRHLYYGEELDLVNLKEELGDLLWYAQLLATAIDSTLNESMDLNEAKLTARYGDKFTEEAAVTRDLAAERGILEGSGGPARKNEQASVLTWTQNVGDKEELPVPLDTLIDLMHRDGEYYYNRPAGRGCCYNWKHYVGDEPGCGDIIRWRLAAPMLSLA